MTALRARGHPGIRLGTLRVLFLAAFAAALVGVVMTFASLSGLNSGSGDNVTNDPGGIFFEDQIGEMVVTDDVDLGNGTAQVLTTIGADGSETSELVTIEVTETDDGLATVLAFTSSLGEFIIPLTASTSGSTFEIAFGTYVVIDADNGLGSGDDNKYTALVDGINIDGGLAGPSSVVNTGVGDDYDAIGIGTFVVVKDALSGNGDTRSDVTLSSTAGDLNTNEGVYLGMRAQTSEHLGIGIV